MKKLIIIFIILALLILPADASFNPIRPNKNAWTCYDHTLNFSENNPDWGVVCMSNNRFFKGMNHIVNYKKIDNNTLLVHDYLEPCDYYYQNWKMDGYYHFYINETPRRYYKHLTDNSDAI